MQLHPKQQGSLNHRAKLLEEQVSYIRRQHKLGVEQRKLALEVGVSMKTIWNIVHRHTWRHCA